MSRASRISVRLILIRGLPHPTFASQTASYGIEIIKALVASQARARYQASPPDVFSSSQASSTRFRPYTPASYIERASYTYKSVQFDGVDFDMDADADYDDDDDDDDDDECDFGCEYDYNDEVNGNGDEPFRMDMDGEKLREVVVVFKSPDRDTLKRPESPETKTKTSIPTILIVPPTVPQIPQTVSTSPPENSIPISIPQISEFPGCDLFPAHASCSSCPCFPTTVYTPSILDT